MRKKNAKKEDEAVRSPQDADWLNHSPAPYGDEVMEEIGEIERYHRIMKLYHLRDYALLYIVLEIALSAVVAALMEWSIVPSTEKAASLLTAVSFLCYSIAVFCGTVHIYLGEGSLRLFCKTAIPPLALLILLALIAGATGGGFLFWCFTPMRLFATLYARDCLQSVILCCIILAGLVTAALFSGCWIANSRFYKSLR